MEILTSIRKNSLGLGIFAVVTAGLIAITHQVTKLNIANNIVKAQLAAFTEILPAHYFDNDLYNSKIELAANPLLGADNGSKKTSIAYVGRLQGKFSAIIFETIAPSGYSGKISLLVAVNKAGVVTGSRIISHKETPGLGDKIDIKKSNWMRSFDDKSFTTLAFDKWLVKKDGGEFDQFTGATITPRAIVKAVRDTLTYFKDNKTALINQ